MIDEEHHNVKFLIGENRSRRDRDEKSSVHSRRVLNRINKTRSIASSNKSVRSKRSHMSLIDKSGEHVEPIIENQS